MMRGILSAFSLTAWSLVSLAGISSAADTGNVTFNGSNRLLFDVDGNHISAYGLKIYYFEDKYYGYGLDFTRNEGLDAPLLCYSSVDLVNWKPEGDASDLSGGRPHIIYNQKTQQYVLWSNEGTGYTVATSSTPTGPFTVVGVAALDPRFTGLQPADETVTTIGDKAYLTWSVLNFVDPRAGSFWPAIFQTLHISPLTDDFLNTTQTTISNVTSAAFDLVDQQSESPDLFVRNGIYYIVASNTCAFCSGSIGVVYRSSSLAGPWERDIVSAYSCGGQVEGVLPLTNAATNETTYVWHATTTPGGPRISFSGHFFQPLRFNDDGSVKDLDCAAGAQYDVPITLGDGAPDSGALTTATDSTPRFADYHYVCDTDLYMRVIQTWTNSESGVLSSVAVNLAAGNQSTNVQVTVFRFSNFSDLVSPEYKVETLGSATFESSDILTSFKAMSVSLNSTVAAGDNLGFSIAETTYDNTPNGFIGLVPYCHLEYNTNATNGTEAPEGQRTFQQGSGQNSYRGLQGSITPIQERRGVGVKFFATVI